MIEDQQTCPDCKCVFEPDVWIDDRCPDCGKKYYWEEWDLGDDCCAMFGWSDDIHLKGDIPLEGDIHLEGD